MTEHFPENGSAVTGGTGCGIVGAGLKTVVGFRS
jgi:hypothetical protein